MKLNKSRWTLAGVATLWLGVAYYFALPVQLFDDPYSTVLEDRSGELMTAGIAKDGQWRFPQIDSVPEKFATALILFEDKRFRKHPGVDVLALSRAMRQNVRSGKRISGGSTLSMQVIRLSRKGKSRSYAEKLLEIILATRLEFRYSKEEILSLYASHAPFGGNVVGLEAACWRYFGRDAHDLSWAEAAMLAVLPNSPSLIHPGKNRAMLKNKRDQLLDRLQQAGYIDAFTCSLSKDELIPDEPTPLPRYAHHLLQRITRDGYAQQRVVSTLDLNLQKRIEQLVQDHHEQLTGNQIYNAAALVLDVETGNVLAYVGNTRVKEAGYHGEEVDIIAAPRSTGSILKPFLFAAMLEEGKLLPNTMLPDVPTVINGFAPKNFSRDYDGAVPAGKALIRSLNVPAVHLLQQYRYERFHSLLKDMGMTTLKRLPDHYGLSLILGGAEGKLWDITGMYASMARTLNHYFENQQNENYKRSDFHQPGYKAGHADKSTGDAAVVLSASAIYQTFDVLKEVYRPGEEGGWRNFYSSKKIAWKTGTSFGYRDGWAVGVTPQYAVGVWVGNADGEGRPGLTGTETAAPIMLDIFSLLPATTWFHEPYMEMEQIAICSQSGMRISSFCQATDTVWVSVRGLETKSCTYHKMIHVTPDYQHRAHRACEQHLVQTSWFVLPPVQEHYYKPKNITYRPLPPFKPGCETTQVLTTMDLVYPKPNARIYIPRQMDGTPGKSVFEIAHRHSTIQVYWHLNGAYVGSTVKTHRMAINPGEGKHTLTIVDELGEMLERQFEVLSN
jgi:penicillin-binding protein 1C